jgi:hypothetical protein
LSARVTNAVAMGAVVQTNFGIELPEGAVEFVRLSKREWVEKHRWPRFTILGQSLGSMLLTWEAIQLCPPHLFVGAGTFPLCSVGSTWAPPFADVLGGIQTRWAMPLAIGWRACLEGARSGATCIIRRCPRT